MTTITTEITELLLLCRQGDRVAFGKLIEAHHGAALGLAQRLLGNHDDAEDALQDALLKTYRKISSLRDGAGFRAWFLRIVYHQCLDARRRRQTRRRYEWAATPQQIEQPNDRASLAETLARVRAIIDELPAKQGAALHLRVFEHMAYDELADVLGLTARSARVYVVKARKHLRLRMGPDLEAS
ncbi:MAG: RNA polymerase sigma-70 factor (ECF subfamily) [Pseudohongiellaceae bacterium]|jgi:RNA polymerase sigma-70 factor (ECF subfamily)